MKKQIISFILVLVMLISIVPVTAFAADNPVSITGLGGGSGTPSDPYKISSADHFHKLVEVVNGGESCANTYFLVTQDFSGVTKSIGGYFSNSDHYFSGNFDGGRHTITVNINNTDTINVGLFGQCAEAGVIKDIILAGTITASQRASGICGYNSGIISGCTNNATITSTGDNAGGIAVYNKGVIANCTNNGDVTGSPSASNYNECGGICTYNYGPIFNCVNNGTISFHGNTTSNYCQIAGIVGVLSKDGKIANCVNTGQISVTQYNNNLGSGICDIAHGECKNCYSLTCAGIRGIVMGDGSQTDIHALSPSEMKSDDTIAALKDFANSSGSAYYSGKNLTWVHNSSTQYPALTAGFKITFVENGGTEQTDLEGQEKLPDSLPSISRTGYQFKGWYTDSSFNTSAVTGTAIEKDTTLYAKWEANKYTVNYDKNTSDSVGSMPANNKTEVKYDEAASLPELTRNGYILFGWATTQNGDKVYPTSAALHVVNGRYVFPSYSGTSGYYDIEYNNGGSTTIYSIWKGKIAHVDTNSADATVYTNDETLANFYPSFASAAAVSGVQVLTLMNAPECNLTAGGMEEGVVIPADVTLQAVSPIPTAKFVTAEQSSFDFLSNGALRFNWGKLKIFDDTTICVKKDETSDFIVELNPDDSYLVFAKDKDTSKVTIEEITTDDVITIDSVNYIPGSGIIEVCNPHKPFPGASGVVVPKNIAATVNVNTDASVVAPTIITNAGRKNAIKLERNDGSSVFPATVTVVASKDAVSIDSDGFGAGVEYTAASDNAKMDIDANGVVSLTSGSVQLDPGERITLRDNNGHYDEIVNPAGSAKIVTLTASSENGPKPYNVSIPVGGKIGANDAEYINGGSNVLQLAADVTEDNELKISVLEGTVGAPTQRAVYVPTATPYDVKNVSGENSLITVTANISGGSVIGANIAVPAGCTFAITQSDGTMVSYTAEGELTSVYVVDGSGNIKLSEKVEEGGGITEPEKGVALKLDKGTLLLLDNESVYANTPAGDKGILVNNPADFEDTGIMLDAGNGSVDTAITLYDGQVIGLGGTLLNSEITGDSKYTATGSAVLALDKTNEKYTDGTVLLSSGAILLDTEDAAIGVSGATAGYLIDSISGTAIVTKTAGDGCCAITILSQGELEIVVDGTTYRYVNGSADPTEVPVKADGRLATVLNDSASPSALPAGNYEGFRIRTVESTTSYTFGDDLDELLAKDNTESGDIIVVNTNLATNPETNGYVLTTNRIDIYTAQGNLAKNNVGRQDVDVDYEIEGVTNLNTVDARERAEFYQLGQEVAPQLEVCMVVKVANTKDDGTPDVGRVQVHAGEAKIQWTNDDLTYYVTLADAVYDASHNTSVGITENQYNLHDGEGTVQTIIMNINPYENRENLTLEAGDILLVRGEDLTKLGDSYTGVDADDFETSAVVTFSMYLGENDVYVTQGTIKVTNNTAVDALNENNDWADAFVGAHHNGYYAKTTSTEDAIYVTAGTTDDGRDADAARLTTSIDGQILEVGVSNGAVLYTGVNSNDSFPITLIGNLDTQGEKVIANGTNSAVTVKISEDYTLYSALATDPAVSSKTVVESENSGAVTVTNDQDNSRTLVLVEKSGDKVSSDPMGDDTDTASTEYQTTENNTVIVVRPNGGSNDPAYEYVNTLSEGALQLDENEVIFEKAGDVKLVNTAAPAITLETGNVVTNNVTQSGIMVTVPGDGFFRSYDSAAADQGLEELTISTESKFFVDETGHITFLDGTIDLALASSINLGTNDEKVTNVDATEGFSITAVRTDGTAAGGMSAFEIGKTTAVAKLPAGKTLTLSSAATADTQSYTNPIKKLDGTGNDTGNTEITILPSGRRAVTLNDIELDPGESIYVTDQQNVKASGGGFGSPLGKDLTLVANTGDTKLQLRYSDGTYNPDNLSDTLLYNIITLTEKGEAKFSVPDKPDRFVHMPSDEFDIKLNTLEAAVIQVGPNDNDKEILVFLPSRLTYMDALVSVGLKSFKDTATDQTIYGKDNEKPALLAISKDGVIYAKKGQIGGLNEGNIVLDPQEDINVRIEIGAEFENVKNIASTSAVTKQVTVSKEVEKNGIRVNSVTVPVAGAVKISDAAFDTSKMSGNTVLDIVVSDGSIISSIPQGDTIKIDGKEYKALEESVINVIPNNPAVVILSSGALEYGTGTSVILDDMLVENRGPKEIETDDENNQVLIPENNTVAFGENKTVVSPSTDTAVTITKSAIDPSVRTLEIPVMPGENVTVDGINYTNTSDTAIVLVVNADTGLPENEDLFENFMVNAPNGLREDQEFTVPTGSSIIVGDREYEAVDDKIELKPNISGGAVLRDPVVIIIEKVRVIERIIYSSNPAISTEKAVNLYGVTPAGVSATAIFTGKRDDVNVSEGGLNLLDSNVWHTVKLGDVTEASVKWNTTSLGAVLSDAGVSNPTKAGFVFAGWYADDAFTKSLKESDLEEIILGDTDIYAKWVKASGTVQGIVYDDASPAAVVSDASVVLYKGNLEIADTLTASDGSFKFENIPEGTYQVVVSKGGVSTTVLAEVDSNGNVRLNGGSRITLTLNNTGINRASSNVNVHEGAPDVVVGGLDAIAEQERDVLNEQMTEGQTVRVEMNVDVQPVDPTDAEQAAIKELASGKALEYIAIDITKTVIVTSTGAVSVSTTAITETATHITIVIPFKTDGRKNLAVYRVHGGAAEEITTTRNADGEYIEIGNNVIIAHLKKFSTYSIGYEIDNGTEPGPGTGTGGGGSSRKTTTAALTASAITLASLCPRDNTCPIEPFTDTLNDFWWHDGIHYCLEHGMMIGYPESIFKPEGKISRAEIVTILWRLMKSPVVNYAMSFGDVKSDEWYTEPIRWAQSTGVVEGYFKEVFAPNDPVTREQMAAILMRFAKLNGIDVANRANLDKYIDKKQISGWALENIQWANAEGIIKGRTETTIVPTGNATRAEAANMLQRFCEMFGLLEK